MEENIFVAENAQMGVCVSSVAALLSYHQKEWLRNKLTTTVQM
jgi:hypothetical protein